MANPNAPKVNSTPPGAVTVVGWDGNSSQSAQAPANPPAAFSNPAGLPPGMPPMMAQLLGGLMGGPMNPPPPMGPAGGGPGRGGAVDDNPVNRSPTTTIQDDKQREIQSRVIQAAAHATQDMIGGFISDESKLVAQGEAFVPPDFEQFNPGTGNNSGGGGQHPHNFSFGDGVPTNWDQTYMLIN